MVPVIFNKNIVFGSMWKLHFHLRSYNTRNTPEKLGQVVTPVLPRPSRSYSILYSETKYISRVTLSCHVMITYIAKGALSEKPNLSTLTGSAY